MTYAALTENRNAEEVKEIDRLLVEQPRTHDGKPAAPRGSGGGYGGKLMALMGQLDRPGKAGSSRGAAKPQAARKRQGRP
ncbi:MAG: hypothetical protein ACJ79H_04425 [Myxococcales bacterium]